MSDWFQSHFAGTLTWWQWLALALVPPAIVALYFLKLKRRAIEVPSTCLWRRLIEDLQVNSIWQRLRRNLLLLLQLLLILLVSLALLRPCWQGRKLSGNRFIFLVDCSASMQATDVPPSRLDEAKRRVGELIDEMQSGDAAMIISFSDTARVEQSFTDDRRQLRRSLEAIRPTQRATSLREALKVASGLATTEKGDRSNLCEAPEGPLRGKLDQSPFSAELLIFSDGKFDPVPDLSLGNLNAIFVPIGRPTAVNVGIVAFRVGRNEVRTDLREAFARLENFGSEQASVAVELYCDDRLANASRVEIPAGKTRGLAFPLGDIESGVLRLKAVTGDDLAIDDEAYAVIGPPRRARVLLVTPGNQPLELALNTRSAAEAADVQVKPPAFLASKPYQQLAAAGALDLVIYDRCGPQQMPQCNTLFIGSLPPAGGWSRKASAAVPQIVDAKAEHPLLHWVDLSEVLLAEGTPLILPPGGSVLVDTDVGPMLAIAPREEFEDAVVGFPVIEGVTNWQIRSFPLFAVNLLDYFGGGRRQSGLEEVRPGQPVTLEAPAPNTDLEVRTPSGAVFELPGGDSGKVSFADTDESGIYEVRAAGKTVRRFAVNLCDAAESNIRPDPQPALKIGYADVPGQSDWEPARLDLWKGLVLLGLAVALLEWHVYLRRVQW